MKGAKASLYLFCTIMAFNGLHRADKWISGKLAYPGIDKNSLTQKKLYWIASLAVTLMIILLTVTYRIIFPQLRIIIYYGFFVAAIFSQGVIFPLFIRRIGPWWMFVNQAIVAIGTLVCILMLGGIPYSGGLVFVGLALVFFSLNFREKRHTILIFIVYLVTLIIAGVLNPYLKVPAEMTPEVNVSLFVINILWISGFAMVFILNFISQGLRIEHMETVRVKELNEAMSRLYTNITHEFRTPLTIITGMIDLIHNEPERWLGEGCEKIEKNSAILLNLVDQMLYLSKLEAGAMPVRKIQSDIDIYIRHIFELFESMAAEKGIKMEYQPSGPGTKLDYDPDMILKIISNLLSNAIKYTGKGGRVIVKTGLKDEGRFVISVIDNGAGIREDKLPHIFERFFQAYEKGDRKLPGSGLGLAVTKELVKLLGGKIKVKSKAGEGTAFKVFLPVTREAPAENVTLGNVKDEIGRLMHLPDDINDIDTPEFKSAVRIKPLLLIVEDNIDVVGYLTGILEEDYEIIMAGNGRDGLTKATENIPDIILSDIMMPEMDGIEMLEKLKNDLLTSHIPVVLLTAKADIDSRLKGIGRGADAYISKPFHREELLVQLNTLIEIRKKLQERYAGIIIPLHLKDNNFNKEDEFIRKVQEIMVSKVSDEKFDVSRFCEELTMSRTQFYRKFKSLTDKTPVEYFQVFRLHRAKELLADPGVSVKEAAYRVGFKNVSHFSRAFKKLFRVNPSHIRK